MGTRDSEDVLVAAGELIEKHRTQAKRAPDFLHAVPYVILRDANGNERIEYVNKQLPYPSFRKGNVRLADAPSFISYFKDHHSDHSAIYASINPCQFVAVLDEHRANQQVEASWRDFRAEFTPALSKEWNTWIGRNGNGQGRGFDSTEEFAYFIEDNAPDFVSPEAAQMMEMALNFKVKQSVNYKAVQRLQDGQVELQYVNVVDATAGRAVESGGAVRVPELFEIEIPLFQGLSVPPQRIQARFRYRLNSGHLRLWYELIRPQKVLEEGFKQLVAEVQDGTGSQVLLGATD